MANEELAERSGSTAEAFVPGDFAALLNKEFKPKSDRAKEEVESAVRTLAEQVLNKSEIVSDDVTQTIQAYVAELDRKISEQLNLIMHHPEFQKLEDRKSVV